MWFSGIYARVEQISPGTISQSASDVMEFRLRGNLGYNWSGNTITNMPRRMFSEIYLLSGGRQFCILHLPCNFACGFFYSLIIWRPPTWGIGPHCDWMSVSAMMAAADVSALKPPLIPPPSPHPTPLQSTPYCPQCSMLPHLTQLHHFLYLSRHQQCTENFSNTMQKIQKIIWTRPLGRVDLFPLEIDNICNG